MYKVEKLGLESARTRYGEEWQSLVDALTLNPSLSPSWLSITAISHCVDSIAKVIVIRNEDDIVAFVPYLINLKTFFGISFREFSLLSNLVCYHNEIIATIPFEDVFELLLEHEPSCNLFTMSSIYSQSKTSAAISSMARTADVNVIEYRGEDSPYLLIRGDWESFFSNLHKKFRYKIRRRFRRLDENPDLKVEWYRNECNTTELLAAVSHVERRSWKYRAGLDVFARDHERTYYELLLPWLSRNDHLLAAVLLLKGAPIAYAISCSWPNWTGFSKTSFDESFSDLEPGAMLLEAIIRDCFKSKTSEFDFLGGADSYKTSWTKHVRKHSDFFLYNNHTVKGRVIGLAKTLRQWLSQEKESPAG